MTKEDVIRDLTGELHFPAFSPQLTWLDQACRLFGYAWSMEYYPGQGYQVYVANYGPAPDTYHKDGVVAVIHGIGMLKPIEIGKGMAFADGYVVLGNARQKVRQYGNAVTPPVSEWLYQRVAPSLS